jgi:hypothetical protein
LGTSHSSVLSSVIQYDCIGLCVMALLLLPLLLLLLLGQVRVLLARSA